MIFAILNLIINIRLPLGVPIDLTRNRVITIVYGICEDAVLQ